MVRAIYGGSFNPIHFGHLGLAEWVVMHTFVDELWLMVTPNNPLKDSHILASEHSRFLAAKEAVREARLEHVVVSDFEFSLPRPNFTAQTLRALCRQFPEDEWVLVIGQDNWQVFDRWREWEWILRNFRILIYPRHRVSAESDTVVSAALESAVHQPDIKGVTFLADAPYFDISSTQLRAAEKQS